MPVSFSISLRDVAATVAHAVTIFVVATVTMSMMPLFGGAVLLWPANPIAAAALTRRSRRRWPMLLAATGAAMIAANRWMGYPAVESIGYCAINLVEILLVASLIRFARPDPRLLRGYAIVVGISIFGAATGTLLFALSRLAFSDGVALYELPHWFAASAMGMIVLLPALKATRRALSEEFGVLSPVVVVPVALSAAAAGLVFAFGLVPSLFLLLPCSVFSALLYRFAGAAASVLAIGVIAVACTLNSIGPVVSTFPVTADRVLFLQLFIGTLTLTAFPVAALLYEQSLALNRFRDNERQLRLLTDHSTDLIVRIGADGLRRYASPASTRLLGYAPDELVGESPFDLIHPDDRDRVSRTIYGLSVDGDGVVFRYRLRHRDGHYLWLEGAFRLVGEGVNRELIGSIRDIGPRQAAEHKAIESATQIEERQRLLTLAESAARIGHWRLNLADRRVFWSPEVFRIHGLPPGKEPALDAAVDCYHPDDRAMVHAQIEAAIASGSVYEFDARIVRPDGAVRWVKSRGHAERAPGAGVVGLFGMFQDTTEQVVAMADLRAAREAAERALAAKETFTATISHEIRTPLTSILAAVQLLRDTPDRTERMRHLDSLEQAGRALSDIVDDVLTYSKLEGGHGSPEAIAFEPRLLLESVVGLFAVDAKRHDVTLHLDAPSGRVVGDPARLQRVLTNLVGNAVKFTRAGSVRITATRKDGDRWRFEVADTGVGIRDDRLDAIFEPFVQADVSTTRSYGGTGLGLSISRMLVESMRGTIHVASRPGTGSRFWFDLPLPAATTAPPPPVIVPCPQAAVAHSTALSSTVLVAEDNDTNRYLIAEIIRRLGHQVVTVENGARAVEYVTAPAGNPVDLVLMDVQMPVMDGIAATRAIRAWSGAGAAVPIYAITADQSVERRAAILQAGMNGVLTKPVDIAQLAALLDRVATASQRPADGQSEPDVIDAVRIQSLTDALGAVQRNTLLGLLIEDAGRVPGRLRTLVAHRRNGLARREAHNLRGAAASMGAARLVAALQRIEGAKEDDTIDPAILDEVDRCAQAVIAAAGAAMQWDR